MKHAFPVTESRHHALRNAVIAALFLAPGAVQAATLTVDTADDELTDNGSCALREAVVNANNNDQSGSTDCPAGEAGPTVDEIVFAAPGIFLLSLGSAGEDDAMGGDLDIREDLTIVGNDGIDPDFPSGTDYDGNTRIVTSAALGDRVVDMPEPDVTLTLEQLVIFGGRGVDDGAGIRSDWESNILTLRNVLVTDNEAHERGGGIHSRGDLIVENSAVFNNMVTGTGNDDVWGGAIWSTGGEITVVDSVVFGNEAMTETGAARAGGIYSSDTQAMITNSMLAGNAARTTGLDASLAAAGGAWLYAPTSIERSAIIGNRAEGLLGESDSAAGGLLAYSSTTTEITNSTFYDNESTSDTGRAEAGGFALNDGELTLDNVTVTGNEAISGSGFGQVGGIREGSSVGDVTISNTAIIGNTDSHGNNPDCEGTLVSAGYNILGDNSECDFMAVASDQIGDVAGGEAPIDPGDVLAIGGAGDNGGGFKVGNAFIPQLTVRLVNNGLAVDAGDPNVPGEGGTCETGDQRGGTRPADGDDDGSAVCDIGAFELDADFPGGGGGGGGAFAPLVLALLGWLVLARGTAVCRGRGRARWSATSPEKCQPAIDRSPHRIPFTLSRVPQAVAAVRSRGFRSYRGPAAAGTFDVAGTRRAVPRTMCEVPHRIAGAERIEHPGVNQFTERAARDARSCAAAARTPRSRT